MAIFDSKSDLIASVCQQIYGRIPHENENLDMFAHHFFKRVPIEFLQKMLIPELASILSEAWKLFQIRQPDESLFKTVEYRLSHHALPRLGIFMVNLDQPFLIDSITAYLDKKGFKMELVVHPVLGVQRTKEGKLISLVDLKETHTLVSSDLGNDLESVSPQNLASEIPELSLRKSNQPESIAFIQIKSNLKKNRLKHFEGN
jgi:glutamate dehydrogenase